VILTVVDRFSKYAHFIALSHPYTAASVAKIFFAEIVRFHGIPSSIVSDQDPVLTSHLWKDLFKLTGSKLRLSTVFHPQTDGQSEVVNRTIAMYLRCITGDCHTRISGHQDPGANIITKCAGTKSHTYDESWQRIECHIFTI
jgi:hypothetical protein